MGKATKRRVAKKKVAKKKLIKKRMAQKATKKKYPKNRGNKAVYYNTQHYLINLLQSKTNLKTHEIMGELVNQSNRLLKDENVDLNDLSLTKIKGSYTGYRGKRLGCSFKFPNTDILIKCSISIEFQSVSSDHNGWQTTKWVYSANTNLVLISFKTPSNIITFTENELNDMIMEGALLDKTDKEIKKLELSK